MDKTKYLENVYLNLARFASNFDIMTALNCGEDKILKYSDLSNYNCLTDLLPETFDYKIILVETDKNVGHWTCIIRMNDVIECFNSYGISIDKEFKYIPDWIENMLGQNKRYLTMMINTCTCPYSVISNTYKFQSKSDNVATCGRWVILRVESARMGYTLQDFVKMIEKQHNKTELPTDILVLDYVHLKDDKKI